MTEKLLGLAIGLCLCYISYQVFFTYQDSNSFSEEANIEQVSSLDIDENSLLPIDASENEYALETKEYDDNKDITKSANLSSNEAQNTQLEITKSALIQNRDKALEKAIDSLSVEDFDSTEHYEALVSALRDRAIQVHEIDQAKEYIGLYLSEVEAELTEVLDEY